jgi:hypothetical protein
MIICSNTQGQGTLMHLLTPYIAVDTCDVEKEVTDIHVSGELYFPANTIQSLSIWFRLFHLQPLVL